MALRGVTVAAHVGERFSRREDGEQRDDDPRPDGGVAQQIARAAGGRRGVVSIRCVHGSIG